MTSEEHRAFFAERGYVVVPGLIESGELERYGKAVDAGVEARTREDRRSLDQKTQYEQSFKQCINLWEDCEDVRPLTFHPALARTAAALLGVDAVRVWHDQALYKEPGGRGTDPHQDQPYWAIEEAETVTAWIPFEGSAVSNGAMSYIPGSHRSGVRAFANIFAGNGFDIENGPEAGGVSPELVEVPLGAVAFHHGLTIHLAGPNTTDRMRRVHTIIYFADGCTRTKTRQRHPSVDRAKIRRGEIIASDVTPIAWPRAEDDLPATPPRPNPPLPGWPR